MRPSTCLHCLIENVQQVFLRLFLKKCGNSHEALRRKLLNIRTDAIARKEGRFQDATWKEAYIKKSVKKKQAKTRTCELCHIQFHNYVQVHLSMIIHD